MDSTSVNSELKSLGGKNGVSSIYTDYFCLSSFPGQQSAVTVYTALTSHYGS